MGGGMRSNLCGNPLIDRHSLCVAHIDDAGLINSHIESTEPMVVPDGIWSACNRHSSQFLSFSLNCDNVDRKRDQGEQHTSLFPAKRIYRMAKGCVHANKEIGY